MINGFIANYNVFRPAKFRLPWILILNLDGTSVAGVCFFAIASASAPDLDGQGLGAARCGPRKHGPKLFLQF
jgi:hypothetical protein